MLAGMRCILHIGTEKTGSTAIQDYLCAHREELKNRDGIHVCTSAGEGNNRALPAAFMPLDRSDDFIRANNFKDDAERRAWKSAFLRRFKKEVTQANASAATFLISSEHFHSRLQTAEEVAELHAFLQKFFEEFQVICYLRRQDQMALSRYSEALRAGLTPEAPLPPAAAILKKTGRLPPLYNFETLLQRWAGSFGESSLRLRIYSRADLAGGDVVHDFISTAGLTVEPSTAPEPSNPALSEAAQATLLSVNRHLSGNDRAAENRMRRELASYLERQAPGRSRQPTEAEAREFFELFRASNAAVARRFFDRELLFDEDFSAYPQVAAEVADDQVLELLVGFMLEQSRSGRLQPDADE